MVYTLNQLRDKIEQRIQEELVDQLPQPAHLYEPIQYTMASGGKRMRPVMLLMAYNLFHDEVDQAINAAVAVEVFHNFTLLHDDVMDDSPLRRGKPTVHKQWDANTALLSGDAMMIRAYQFLAADARENLPKTLDVFNKMALGVCEGQQYDMDFEARQQVSENEYIEMIQLKTSVLIAGAMQIGALLAGARPQDAQHLYDYGLNLGVAFQLQDDYLDVFGDPDVFGKRIGGDILANKKTYLLIKARELVQGKDKELLEHYLSDAPHDEDVKIQQVKGLYERLQIKQITEQRIDKHYQQAKQRLADIPIANSRKAGLTELAESLMARVH